jgi:hypothetical protein
VSRRASLPGASELFFRSTSNPTFDAVAPEQPSESRAVTPGGAAPAAQGDDARLRGAGTGGELPDSVGGRRSSPRKKHDAKITVYVAQDELLALEHARLALRASHDLAVDRGRLVREAVAVVLSDFEQRGEESVLVRRLREDEAPGGERDSR